MNSRQRTQRSQKQDKEIGLAQPETAVAIVAKLLEDDRKSDLGMFRAVGLENLKTCLPFTQATA
jgi:hypothetical protein